MVKKMEKTRVEKQGRILLPKRIRQQLGIRIGEEIAIQVGKNEIVLKLFRSKKEFSSELKGCVKESRIRPLNLKKMWEM